MSFATSPLRLAHTQFAEATCATLRLKLLKIGVLVSVSSHVTPTHSGCRPNR
jgi:hypothetical protein